MMCIEVSKGELIDKITIQANLMSAIWHIKTIQKQEIQHNFYKNLKEN